MKLSDKTPVYTIGIVAKMVGVCPATLRLWEKKGLIKVARVGRNRYYSKCDLEQLIYIRKLLNNKHLNIEGVKKILEITQCWVIKKCTPEERATCPIYQKNQEP